MKQFFLTAFASLFFLVGNNQAQTYQDTTFTDPVLILFPTDFVTFNNCRFLNIDGDAIILEGAGVLISNCRFENITGSAVYARFSEVYMVEDTISQAFRGLYGYLSAVSAIGCELSNIGTSAFEFDECDVSEVKDCNILGAERGVFIIGSAAFEEAYIINTSIRQVYGENAIGAYNIDQLTITGSSVDSCLGGGILLQNVGSAAIPLESVLLQSNKISRTNYWGISADGVNNAVIRDNEVSYPGFLDGLPGVGDGCLYWKGDNGRIERNSFHHALDPGCGQDDCRSVGIWLANSAIVTKNIIRDCTGHGIYYQNDQNDADRALQIFNNFIFDVGGNSISYNGMGSNMPEPMSVAIRNNTLHSAQSAPIAVCCNETLVSAEGNILLFEGQVDTSKFIEQTGFSALNETLNIKSSGDLNFVDFAGRDFHLASETSPAHNALPLNFGLPNDDFDGDLRLGLRDVGADELVLDTIICGCNNCPNPIPDLFYGDFTFSVLAADKNDLSVSGQGVCGVRIAFEHEYIGDVTMSLISPAGQTVELIGPSGFWGDTKQTNWNIGFVPCGYPTSPDPGFSAVWNSNQPWGDAGAYTGVYYPANGCLENFNVGTVTGDWTLRVFDNQADDTGIVSGFEVMFCDPNGVSCFLCSEPPVANFVPNPSTPWGIFLNNVTTGNATAYDLDFGDGESVSGLNFPAFHLYENAGTYQIRLIATNDCGVDTFTQQVVIAGALPTAFAFAQPAQGCSPLEVQTVVANPDHVDTYHWLFPGGTPSESFEMAPKVTYTTGGAYLATLILENEVGVTTIQDIFPVFVEQGLTNPSFNLQTQGDSILCTHTTLDATSFYWTLNGGPITGLNTNPWIFEVAESGNYTVGFFATSICDTVLLTEEVDVVLSGTQNLLDAGWKFSLAPNPNRGLFNLDISALEESSAKLSVLNALGVSVFDQNLRLAKGDNQINMELGQIPSGMYYVQIQTEKGQANLRLIIQ